MLQCLSPMFYIFRLSLIPSNGPKRWFEVQEIMLIKMLDTYDHWNVLINYFLCYPYFWQVLVLMVWNSRFAGETRLVSFVELLKV